MDVYDVDITCRIFFPPASNIEGSYGLIIMRNEQFSSMGFSSHLKNNLNVAANKGREKPMYFFSQGQSSLVLSHLMNKASPSSKVVPSDGVGGASGHGLFATVKGVLWSCRSLVVSTAPMFMFLYFHIL